MPSYAGPPVASRPGEVASTLRLLGYLALTIALVVMDHRGGWLSQLRSQLNVVTQPLWWVAGLPGRVTTRVQDDAATRAGLIEENGRLRNDLLVANARLARLQTAATDNAQLRALLGVKTSRGLDVQLAPILDVDLAPGRQRLVLDVGSRAGAKVGQSVIDAGGLMGQIIDTTPTHATVLLSTRAGHLEVTVTNDRPPVGALPGGPVDGSTPSEDGPTGSGLGLVGMRERVAAAGGQLQTGPTRDGGFRVAAQLPLAPRTEVTASPTAASPSPRPGTTRGAER